jgi:phosphoglycolate phosphatase
MFLNAPKVIIYDCDGVLIDSRRANEAFYNHILARFGLPPLTQDQLDWVQMSTAQQSVARLFHGSPCLPAAQAYQLTIDNRPFLSLLRLEPHVRETLGALRPTYRTAIVTNRGKSLPLVLKELGLESLFDLTVTCYDVRRPKPDPEGVLKVLDYFRAAPEEALYIGDAAVDCQVARAVGITFAAYKNPGLKARYHLEDHLDLLKVLDQSPAR